MTPSWSWSWSWFTSHGRRCEAVMKTTDCQVWRSHNEMLLILPRWAKRTNMFLFFGACRSRDRTAALLLIKEEWRDVFQLWPSPAEPQEWRQRATASLCFNMVSSNRALRTSHMHVRPGLRARDARHLYAFFMNTEGVITPCVTLFERAPLAPS